MNMERPLDAGGHGSQQDSRPIVAVGQGGLGGGAIAAGCIAAAALLFLVLNQQRLAREHPAPEQPEARMSAPPPLAFADDVPGPPRSVPAPPAPLLTPPAVKGPAAQSASQSRSLTWRQLHPVIIEQWPPAQTAPNGEEPARGTWPQLPPAPMPMAPSPSANGPAIVEDSGASRLWSTGKPAVAETARPGPAQTQSAPATALLRPIGDLSQVIAVGTMIEAVLETPVDSSRPGMTRAIISRAVRSFDGARLLIPRGARLVGELNGQAEGGRRVLIKWSQVILPDGTALEINSPGADARGQAGLDAKSHGELGRLIEGVLQTAVTIGATALGARNAPVYYGVPMAGSATQLVPRSGNGKRLTVAAGAKINVVVARTLDFGGSAVRP